MSDFLTAIVSFPTVVFTVLLGIVLGYWSMVIFGALDIDTFDADLDLDVGTEFDLGDVGGDVGGDVDADMDVDAGGDGDADAHGLAHWLETFGLAGVPITIAVSFIVFFGWVFSLLGSLYLPSVVGETLGPALLGSIVGLISFAASIPLAALCSRPLRKVFITHEAVSRNTLIGKRCRISTGRVDAEFGQAEIEDGGAGFLVQVRNLRDNDLTRGSTAVVYDFDKERDAFLVAPLDESSPLIDEALQRTSAGPSRLDATPSHTKGSESRAGSGEGPGSAQSERLEERN